MHGRGSSVHLRAIPYDVTCSNVVSGTSAPKGRVGSRGRRVRSCSVLARRWRLGADRCRVVSVSCRLYSSTESRVVTGETKSMAGAVINFPAALRFAALSLRPYTPRHTE
eukprot:2113050-Prymnesium_polylepis.2